jgi:uncharacterized metal-binding protein
LHLEFEFGRETLSEVMCIGLRFVVGLEESNRDLRALGFKDFELFSRCIRIRDLES